MDIRCPQCSTLYEFDETRIRGRSVNFKCSQCGTVFRVQGPTGDSPKTPRNRWMVKKVQTGDILYFTGMQSLQKWIIDRQVTRQDEISKTGSKWKALGDIGELSSFFQVAESIERVQPGSQPPAPVRGQAAVPIGAASQPAPQPAPRPAPQPAPQPRQPTPTPTAVAAPLPASTAPRPSSQVPQAIAPRPPAHEPAPVPQHQLQPIPELPPRTQAPRPKAGAGPTDSWGGVQPMETGGWSIGGSAASPAPAPRRGGSMEVDLASESGRDYDDAPPRKSPVVPIIVVVLVLLLGAGVTVTLVRPDLLGLRPAKPADTTAVVAAAVGQTPDAATTPEVAAEEDTGEVVAKADPDAAAPPEVVPAKDTPDDPPVHKDDKPARHASDGDDSPMGGSYDGLMSKGYRFLRSGNGDKALAAFQAAAAKSPSNSEPQASIGWAYLTMGNAQSAIAAFNKAIAMNSRYGDAYIGLGQAYRSAGQKAQALKAYEQYLAFYPSGPKASIARHQAETLRDQLRPQGGGGTPNPGGGAPTPDAGGAPTGGTPAPTPANGGGEGVEKVIVAPAGGAP